MLPDQVDVLNAFRQFIKAAEQGAQVPSVDAQDLKNLHELCIDRAKRYCGKDGVISLEMTSRVCSTNASLPAVWLRHTQLRSLYREGLLIEWQRGATLEEAVFQLAASIPMSGTRLDQRAFVENLRAMIKK